MIKFDHNIIDILNEYLPYIYDKSINISLLELEIDYRQEANNILYQINKLKEKAFNYRKRKISSEHISCDISSLQNIFQLYMTWGALQVFYKNNYKNIDYNVLDLHGLYQKEAASILYICIKYLNLTKLNIITGKGSGAIFNITQSVLKEFKIKYKIESNCIITF